MDALRGEAQEHVQVRTGPLAGRSTCPGPFFCVVLKIVKLCRLSY